MSEYILTTNWMWNDNGEVWGLRLNIERQVIEWSDAIGCACGGSSIEQTFADFIEKGPRYGNPPELILAEVIAGLHTASNNTKVS